MNIRKQYNSLDLAKFIAAILIIAIHTSPFASVNKLISFGFRNAVLVLAVPFFFTTSGFLFFKKLNDLKDEERSAYFKKYIKRIASMYLLWSAVYFIFVFIDWTLNGVTWSDIIQYIKEFFLKGSYSTLWFLIALLAAVTIVYFLRKKLSYTKIFLCALPFYVVACLGSSYYGISEQIPLLKNFFDAYYDIFLTVKNGALFGWVYVALGGIFAEKEFKISPIKKIFFILLFDGLVLLESIVQTYFGWRSKGADTLIFLLPVTFFIFLFVLNLNIQKGDSFVFMRKISLLLFLSQRIFLTLFEWFLYDTIFVTNSVIFFASIFALTFTFSVLFIKTSEKLSFLKRFY